MSKYMEIRPHTLGFSENFENDQIVRIVLLILYLCFQKVLNDFPILSQTQIIHIFVFSTQNTQIWKYGHRPPHFQKMFPIIKLLE